MHIIILSGGVGSRLWPVSKALSPKPFIKMEDGLSLLQQTMLRAIKLEPKSIVHVTAKKLLPKIKKESNKLLTFISPLCPIQSHYLLEPLQGGTAASIAFSSLFVEKQYDREDILLILPSDHIIDGDREINHLIQEAKNIVLKQNHIVIFGIPATSAETEYGYIKHDGQQVRAFIEKPDVNKAMEYCNSGDYLWNVGIFCFKAGTMLDEMAKHCPDILETINLCFDLSIKSGSKPFDILNINKASLKLTRKTSIDYAVIEKSNKISVVSCNFKWQDVGTWKAMSNVSKHDDDGNVIKAKAVISDVTNCYIQGKNRVIGAVGLHDLVIIDTPNALLVANKNNTEGVKEIYEKLHNSDLESDNNSRIKRNDSVYKSQNNYTTSDCKFNFRIKHIKLNCISTKRSCTKNFYSNITVVNGSVLIFYSNKEPIILKNGESTKVDNQSKYTLINLSGNPIDILEIQILN